MSNRGKKSKSQVEANSKLKDEPRINSNKKNIKSRSNCLNLRLPSQWAEWSDSISVHPDAPGDFVPRKLTSTAYYCPKSRELRPLVFYPSEFLDSAERFYKLNTQFTPSNAMGWGQPIAGKRVRHCSDENSSEFNGNSENFSSEMKTHFGKRPRDVSPLNRKDSEEDLSNPAERLSLTASVSEEDHSVASCSAGCSTSFNGARVDREYSLDNVIVDSAGGDDANGNYEGFVTELKISTATPKHYNAGTSKMLSLRNSRISNSRKGPRIVASCRARTAIIRRPVVKNAKIPSSSSSSDTVSDGLWENSNSQSDEEDCEEEDDEFLQIEGDSTCPEESMHDGVSVCRVCSVDMIPSSNVVRRILPSLRPSFFPNVPPYINFCLHDERTETLPKEIQKHLKWRLSPITPLVVKNTLSNSGFRLLRKTVEWNGQWGKHMKAALFRSSLKDFQKLNHLPGTFQIGRKDRLWKNIHRFMTKFGKDEFGFIPRTYVLPHEMKQLKTAWDSTDSKGQLWIVKPPAGARGTGIRVVSKWNQVPKKKSVIVQSYISNPCLINDRKFDLRVYVLVTSFHPLKIFCYNDGLVRFAPLKYSHDVKRAGDRFMHLTNYSVNKNCELYTHNEDAESYQGHKWTLKTLWRYFQEQGKDTVALWDKIEEIVIKTLISAEEPITASAHNLPNRYNGYELFGFDIILDSDLKPWLLEVNISPSLNSSSPLDLAVKGPMIKEVFNIVGFHLPPKLSPLVKTMLTNSLDVKLELETPVFDKRIYTSSLSKEELIKHKSYKSKDLKRSQYLEEAIESLTPDDIRQLIIAEDEMSQVNNFVRVFPTNSSHSYFPYFEVPRYYNVLFDAWENKYYDNRSEGCERLSELCREKIHLHVPVTNSMTSGSQEFNHLAINTDIEDLDQEARKLSECSSIVAEKAQTGDAEDESTSGSSSTTTTASPITAVLDNITNNNNRGTSISINNCHDEDRFSNGKPVAPIPNKVTEYVKGICY